MCLRNIPTLHLRKPAILVVHAGMPNCFRKKLVSEVRLRGEGGGGGGVPLACYAGVAGCPPADYTTTAVDRATGRSQGYLWWVFRGYQGCSRATVRAGSAGVESLTGRVGSGQEILKSLAARAGQCGPTRPYRTRLANFDLTPGQPWLLLLHIK